MSANVYDQLQEAEQKLALLRNDAGIERAFKEITEMARHDRPSITRILNQQDRAKGAGYRIARAEAKRERKRQTRLLRTREQSND